MRSPLQTSPKDKNLKWIKKMTKTKSRTVLTSGGVEPVVDGGGGGHSVFAKYFIKALSTEKKIITGPELYEMVKKNVFRNAPQTPLYNELYRADSEGGDYFLKTAQEEIPRNSIKAKFQQ